MSFLDKAKTLADQAQRSIEQGVSQAQDKLEEARRHKQLEDLAAELGWLVYRSRGSGGPPEAEVTTLEERIAAVEAEIAAAKAAKAAKAAPAGAGWGAAPAPPPSGTGWGSAPSGGPAGEGWQEPAPAAGTRPVAASPPPAASEPADTSQPGDEQGRGYTLNDL